MDELEPINRYIELATPQVNYNSWRDLSFELAAGHNILQELVVPESGGGYAYHDLNKVGSHVHNRFIYWRTYNDTVELVEVSPEVILEGSHTRIRFTNSPVINDIKVIEQLESITIIIATVTSVHRFTLPHPKTTQRSILYDLNGHVLSDPTNYHLLETHNPICATSWLDTSASLFKCAVAFSDSSLVIVQFDQVGSQVTTTEIKQVGIIGKLWSRMPNLFAKNPGDCDNAVFTCIPFYHEETRDTLLFTLCRDLRIRVFSTKSRECVYTYNLIPQSSFSQSFANHANLTTEQPIMKMSETHLVIYMTENQPEFIILGYEYHQGNHTLTEILEPIHAPSFPENLVDVYELGHYRSSNRQWENIIDFLVTDLKVWVLAHVGETEIVLCYLDLASLVEHSKVQWYCASLFDYSDTPIDMNDSKEFFIDNIFWRNNFSINTIQRALVAIAGRAISETDIESLENEALDKCKSLKDWSQLFQYCLENRQVDTKVIGLVASADESIVGLLRRSNPSFICPWAISFDMVNDQIPYRGVNYSKISQSLIESLNYISTKVIDQDLGATVDHNLKTRPFDAPEIINQLVSQLKQSVTSRKLNFGQDSLALSIEEMIDELDLTAESQDYRTSKLSELHNKLMSDRYPLESNNGIATTFAMFRQLVTSRMTLARDLLVFLGLMSNYSKLGRDISTKHLGELHDNLLVSCKIKRLIDSLRSYSTLVWITDAPIRKKSRSDNTKAIMYISSCFNFIKYPQFHSERSQDTPLDILLGQNLFMNFLLEEGTRLSASSNPTSDHPRTMSNSSYVADVAMNLCKILWPISNSLCFAEFLFTRHLEEHLANYLSLLDDWTPTQQLDRIFLRAANHILEHKMDKAVDSFSRLCMSVTDTGLLGRFIRSESDETVQCNENTVLGLQQRFFERLINLFELCNRPEAMVLVINKSLTILDMDLDEDHCLDSSQIAQTEARKRWINCLRAKLFLYYLELDNADEAYHTMVLTSEDSLRLNCLRKFIVHHCEKEQWSSLLSYPFGTRQDFIEILSEKAKSMDLSTLISTDGYYKTSYYDLLFSSFVYENKFQEAAKHMYNYSQRLARELPGVDSVRKQRDCLLIALNTLRCVERPDEAYFEVSLSPNREARRSHATKRGYDSESNSSIRIEFDNDIDAKLAFISLRDVEIKYQLARARVKLLERDQTANAIALSPLSPQETIALLVSSSLFTSAVDLALLTKSRMEPIMEGLTAKYIFTLNLSTSDLVVHHYLEKNIPHIFTDGYSIIDTYSYVANSLCPLSEKIKRLMDYYITTYDGISHTYHSNQFAGTFDTTSVLMRVVAQQLLSSGNDVPAFLKKMYQTRNTPELLRLLIKYDRLLEAADLASEMTEKVIQPANTLAFVSPFSAKDAPPVYLPTHVIILLIDRLKEDATKTTHMKSGDTLAHWLEKFRNFCHV